MLFEFSKCLFHTLSADNLFFKPLGVTNLYLCLFVCVLTRLRTCAAGAVRGDVVPGGSGLGERVRRDVRQRQHKRGRGVQGAAEPGEDQVRLGPVAAAQLGPETVAAVRRRWFREPRAVVDGAHAGATRAPAEEGRLQQQQQVRRRRRQRREIETQLVFNIVKTLLNPPNSPSSPPSPPPPRSPPPPPPPLPPPPPPPSTHRPERHHRPALFYAILTHIALSPAISVRDRA